MNKSVQIEYSFAIPSKLYIGQGEWQPLAFPRKSVQVTLPKPVVKQLPYVSLDLFRGALGELRTRPDWARSAGTTLVSVEMRTDSPISREDIQTTLGSVAFDVVNDFKDWVRFLARQYWVGYAEDRINLQRYTVNVVDGNSKQAMDNAGRGSGYDYYKWLDEEVWKAIGIKLSRNDRPRPGQLLFCDGLLRIMELNTPSAILALGTSCEMEVFALLEEILEVDGEQYSLRPEEIEWRRFTEKLRALEELCSSRFFDFDQNGDRLVKELYKLRGKAAHRGRVPVEDPQIPAQARVAKILCYVDATEKLFSWLEIQRSRHCQKAH